MESKIEMPFYSYEIPKASTQEKFIETKILFHPTN